MNLEFSFGNLIAKNTENSTKEEGTWEVNKLMKFSSEEGRSSSDDYMFSSPDFEKAGNGDAEMREFFNFDGLPDQGLNLPSIAPPSLSHASSPNLSNSQDEAECLPSDRQQDYINPSLHLNRTVFPTPQHSISDANFLANTVDQPLGDNPMFGESDVYLLKMDPMKQAPYEAGFNSVKSSGAIEDPLQFRQPITMLETPFNESINTLTPYAEDYAFSSLNTSAPPLSNKEYAFSVNHLPAINEHKWKSRVETNMLFELRIKSNDNQSVPFEYLRLPSWAHREDKKRSSKPQPLQPDPETVIHLVPTVLAGDKSSVVKTCCTRCLLRERKRNARSQATKDACMPNYTKLKAYERNMTDASPEEKQQFRIKLLNQFPKLEDIDEDRMIMVFTGPEYVRLQLDGNERVAHINARITCYSSHQSCPYFHIIWDLYSMSRLVDRLVFPEPVTVLDDHKSRNLTKSEKTGKSNSQQAPSNHVLSKSNTVPNLVTGFPTRSDNPPNEKRRRTSSSENSRALDIQLSASDSHSPNSKSTLKSVEGSAFSMSKSPSVLSMTTPSGVSPSISKNGFHVVRVPSDAAGFQQRQQQEEGVLEAHTNESAPIAPFPYCTDDFSFSVEEKSSVNNLLTQFDEVAKPDFVSTPIKENVDSSFINMTPPDVSHAPLISRIIPNKGSIMGGYEVTILGANFFNGLVCLFGDNPAAVTFSWSESTIIATCPPATNAGTVPVTFQNYNSSSEAPVMFTYEDNLDNELYKLTVQVLGLKLTGSIQNPLTLSKKLLSSWRDDFAQYITNSIKQPPNSESKGQSKKTLLHDSNMESLKSVISRIVKKDSNQSDDSVESTILAAFALVTDTTTPYLSDFSLVNESGRSLLHLTAACGLSNASTFLCNAGCDVNKRDALGYTPLHYASLYDHKDICVNLLSNGAKPDVIGASGKKPIDLSSSEPIKLVFKEANNEQAQSISRSLIKDSEGSINTNETLESTSIVNEIEESAVQTKSYSESMWNKTVTMFPSLQELPQNYMSEVPSMMQKAMLSTLKSISAIPDDVPPPYSEFADDTTAQAGSSKRDSAISEDPDHHKSVWWSLRWQSRLVGRGKSTALTPEETRAIQEQAKTLKKAGMDFMLFSFWLPALLLLSIFGLRSYAQMIGGYLYRCIIGI
ncbi:Ankyrin and IPT/TIG repeat-containing protein C26H5.05 [Schizosaccharomyces pombe]|uniref:Ankyrin and IPT/TIG repeat-containing protein C26H5.05 n=1 Tax=Schizosaccharomyces pombe (strain 972 / ATCC 24843) TaxID=284812 RepID=YEG5_SCHPO|nr:putative IPT/TIG ankyrin repeat-containing transcription regulator [Schizosaccharomyces pombe]O13987.1 RecName: Full=Ankyrin and IPT/TIG repeat-containing protein C26H5.05 [Schizosaccharomyces pombe 972h-]CAB16191.1 IPT/TIG ankyrin repeat containing transcription regulator of fatty acid biosynthesis (predicted) [Schizosaccharomyces pombe]|eukprot:NP_594452.1 putative IPT/TIG ankyrin repeat-containing transcription regulator [Schizosaccharomyces pombe]